MLYCSKRHIGNGIMRFEVRVHNPFLELQLLEMKEIKLTNNLIQKNYLKSCI